MESWRKVWRKGLAPLLSTKSLEVLAVALATDDPRLIQGATTTPPPLQCVQDWPVEAACAVGFCGWQGEGLETVAEVEEFFSKILFEVDALLGEPGGCRYFLHFWDENRMSEVKRLLLPEIESSLAMKRNSDEASQAS